MSDFRVVKIDDIEAIAYGTFRRARAALDVSAFGMQVLDLPPNLDAYPEHDHAEDGQEEVYVVLEGSADLEVAGERAHAEAGTMLRVDAAAKRKLVPGAAGVRVLAIGCAPGGAYERPQAFRSAARA